jgi:uncharacterized membrane protein YtjA (UPF0391 family)
MTSKDRKSGFGKWALSFLIVAVIAGALGFFAIVGLFALILKVLFWIFLIACIASLIVGWRLARR